MTRPDRPRTPPGRSSRRRLRRLYRTGPTGIHRHAVPAERRVPRPRPRPTASARGDAGWTVDGECLVVEPDSGDVRTTESPGDCQLHVEWATPPDPGDAASPGNSGVFLADRYELQILDCSATTIYADGWVGAVYGQHPPAVAAGLSSGEWQSFDIVWRRPRFDDETLRSPARITALHNGVAVQSCTEAFGPTTYRDFREYTPHGPAPLRLQDHGFRVRFRNIWYRPL